VGLPRNSPHQLGRNLDTQTKKNVLTKTNNNTNKQKNTEPRLPKSARFFWLLTFPLVVGSWSSSVLLATTGAAGDQRPKVWQSNGGGGRRMEADNGFGCPGVVCWVLCVTLHTTQQTNKQTNWRSDRGRKTIYSASRVRVRINSSCHNNNTQTKPQTKTKVT
jgi:hypothetical protein